MIKTEVLLAGLCQLSRIGRESHAFEHFLTVSRQECVIYLGEFTSNMFSSWDHLAHKTPTGSLNRLEFLQQLVTEYQTSQEQDMLSEPNETLVVFGIGGICNLALDKKNKEHILANDGIQQVVQCLSSTNEDIILSTITTLMFLVTPVSKPDITAPHVLMCMERFCHSPSKRISNVASVFLQDYCTKDQQLQARQLYENESSADTTSSHNIPSPTNIPLPSGPPPESSASPKDPSPSDIVPISEGPT
ncbi:armadillo repeat-containing protein 7-like isoform X2 [Amphiura filiformis]|uniref:armadillo repeat-containing protein 7-like isoform X2 n=1 Tax=Amphiura filiformis TaxID=82378 RepID=UPI003B20D102